MTVPYAPYSQYLRLPPPESVPANWSIQVRPAMTDVQAAIAGTFAAGTETPSIIGQLSQAIMSLNAYDAAGNPDPVDYARLTALVQVLMRRLGLYPIAYLTAVAANPGQLGY